MMLKQCLFVYLILIFWLGAPHALAQSESHIHDRHGHISPPLNVRNINVYDSPQKYEACIENWSRENCQPITTLSKGTPVNLMVRKEFPNSRQTGPRVFYLIDLSDSDNSQYAYVPADYIEVRSSKASCDHEGLSEVYNEDVAPILEEAMSEDSAYAYESCTPGNNYFEELMAGNRADEELNSSFSPRRTFEAIKMSSDRRFIKCSGAGDGRGQRTGERPCLSEALHKQVHNGLVEISNCMGMDPEVLFSLFLTESSFVPNAVSETGARGMGMLTGTFVETRNRQVDGYINNVFSKRPECADTVKRVKEYGRLSVGGSCDEVAPPKSPFMNMFYSALGLLNIQMQRVLPTYLEWAPLDGVSPSEDEKALFKEQQDIARRIQQLEREARSTNANRLQRIRTELQNLRARDRELRREIHYSRIRGRMNRFSELSTNAKKIISEVSFYGYNNGETSIGLQFEYFTNRRSFEEAGAFSSFTGPNGAWLNTFTIGPRGDRDHLSEEGRNFIYQGTPNGRGAGSTMTGKIDRVNERAGQKCGMY